MGWRLAGKRVWLPFHMTSQVVLVVKNPIARAGDITDMGSIPGLRRSPGAGHGNPLQYSCLVIPWTEEPGGLQSVWSQRVGRDWSDLARTPLHTEGAQANAVAGRGRRWGYGQGFHAAASPHLSSRKGREGMLHDTKAAATPRSWYVCLTMWESLIFQVRKSCWMTFSREMMLWDLHFSKMWQMVV